MKRRVVAIQWRCGHATSITTECGDKRLARIAASRTCGMCETPFADARPLSRARSITADALDCQMSGSNTYRRVKLPGAE